MKRLTALDVRCSQCGATVGERCRRLDDPGQRATTPHAPRTRRAREEQARLNPEHTDGQLGLFPAKDARR